MKKEIILAQVTEILKDTAGVHGTVPPSANLKNYLPAAFLYAFATEVAKAYPKLDLTELANSFYDPINNLNALTDYIYDKYK